MSCSIDRTATTCWSPANQSNSVLAVGTVAGALDATFSSSTVLELFSVSGGTGPSNGNSGNLLGSCETEYRFNRLTWTPHGGSSLGLIVGGLESGKIQIWDPAKLTEQNTNENPCVFESESHGSSVRGLEHNPFQPYLLAAGSSDSQILIYDLNNLASVKPFSPGPPSSKLEDISSLQWNRKVQHILATASVSGFTSIWDLRNKREIMQLANPQGRKSVTAVAWNPENATQLLTAIDDDANPVILSWDLRNAHAPEKVLSGHDKGILSLAWNPKDSELLLSAGKDHRVICWNPKTSTIVGELPKSINWTFDVQWCPRNPDLLSTASFDGKVNVYSLTSSLTAVGSALTTASSITSRTNDDPFGFPPKSFPGNAPVTMAPAAAIPAQTPRWLRRPIGATFGFGGRLVTFANTAAGYKVVSVKSVVTTERLWQKSVALETALKEKSYLEYCTAKANEYRKAGSSVSGSDAELVYWNLLKTMFEREPRQRLLELLGNDRAKIVRRVERTIQEAIKHKANPKKAGKAEEVSVGPYSLLNLFKMHNQEENESAGAGDLANLGSQSIANLFKQLSLQEVRPEYTSGSVKGGSIQQIDKKADNAVPKSGDDVFDNMGSQSINNLFNAHETNQPLQPKNSVTDGNDIFDQMGSQSVNNLFMEQQQNTATTIGATSNVNQEVADIHSMNLETKPPVPTGQQPVMNNIFKEEAGNGVTGIEAKVPEKTSFKNVLESKAPLPVVNQGNLFEGIDKSLVDGLIAKCLIVGDFGSAIDLCFAANRASDALLFASCAGPDVLARAQAKYFQRKAQESQYLGILKSAIGSEYERLIEHVCIDDNSVAGTEETVQKYHWMDVLSIFSTFVKSDDFCSLTVKLGQKLETMYGGKVPALTCYIVSGNYERVILLWFRDLETVIFNGVGKNNEKIGLLIQDFVEKVCIYRAAIDYESSSNNAGVGGSSSLLIPLETIMQEYAGDLSKGEQTVRNLKFIIAEYCIRLSGQGLVDTARRYLPWIGSEGQGGLGQSDNQHQQQPDLLWIWVDRISEQRNWKVTVPPSEQEIMLQQQQQQQQQQSIQNNTPSAYPYQSNPVVPSSTGATNTFNPAYPGPYNPYGGNPNISKPSIPAPPNPVYGGSNSNPGYSNPGYNNSGFNNANPGYSNPGYNNPGYSNPGYNNANPGYNNANPGYTNPGYTNPGSRPPPPPVSFIPPSGGAGPQSAITRKVSGGYNDPPPVPAKQHAAPPMPIVRPSPPQYPATPTMVPSGGAGQLPANPVSNPPQPSMYGRPPPPSNPGAATRPPPPGAVPPGVMRPPPPAMSQPQPPIQQQPPPSQQIVPKKHPPGDRTHIPGNLAPIHKSFSAFLGFAKSRSLPPQKRMVEDSEKRFNVFFDTLNNNGLSAGVVGPLLELSEKLEKQDWYTAAAIQVNLMSSHYSELGHFLLGLKRLLDIVKVAVQ